MPVKYFNFRIIWEKGRYCWIYYYYFGLCIIFFLDIFTSPFIYKWFSRKGCCKDWSFRYTPGYLSSIQVIILVGWIHGLLHFERRKDPIGCTIIIESLIHTIVLLWLLLLVPLLPDKVHLLIVKVLSNNVLLEYLVQDWYTLVIVHFRMKLYGWV